MKTSIKTQDNNQGFVLLAIIIISALAVTIFTGATAAIGSQLLSSNRTAISAKAHGYAESGVEEAMMQILRQSDYTGGTLNLEGTTVTISVSGSPTKTITSSATYQNTKRTIQAVATPAGNSLKITSWQEI